MKSKCDCEMCDCSFRLHRILKNLSGHYPHCMEFDRDLAHKAFVEWISAIEKEIIYWGRNEDGIPEKLYDLLLDADGILGMEHRNDAEE